MSASLPAWQVTPSAVLLAGSAVWMVFAMAGLLQAHTLPGGERLSPARLLKPVR
jgi:hypothetical protein